MKYIIANWKAKITTSQEVHDWFVDFESFFKFLNQIDVSIIIAPSYIYLSLCREIINKNNLKNIYLASQSVSSEKMGAHTGEVTIEMIKEYCDYCLLGHSERRDLGETNLEIEQKLILCNEFGVKSILCIKEKIEFSNLADIISYEPKNAIGTGQMAPTHDISNLYSTLPIPTGVPFLYGGSVNISNLKFFQQVDFVDGFLVGGQSIDGKVFAEIVNEFVKK